MFNKENRCKKRPKLDLSSGQTDIAIPRAMLVVWLKTYTEIELFNKRIVVTLKA